ncbi:hypothetical protein GVAV_003374 [Gurleya vavrai]
MILVASSNHLTSENSDRSFKDSEFKTFCKVSSVKMPTNRLEPKKSEGNQVTSEMINPNKTTKIIILDNQLLNKEERIDFYDNQSRLFEAKTLSNDIKMKNSSIKSYRYNEYKKKELDKLSKTDKTIFNIKQPEKDENYSELEYKKFCMAKFDYLTENDKTEKEKINLDDVKKNVKQNEVIPQITKVSNFGQPKNRDTNLSFSKNSNFIEPNRQDFLNPILGQDICSPYTLKLKPSLPCYSLNNKQHLNETLTKANQKHMDTFSNKRKLAKNYDYKDYSYLENSFVKKFTIDNIQTQDIKLFKYSLIAQTHTQNVFFTMNNKFVYKASDDNYLILYSEGNTIFKTYQEEFFFWTNCNKVVLMSNNLKQQILIIENIHFSLFKFKEFYNKIIKIEFNLQDILEIQNQIEVNSKKRFINFKANINFNTNDNNEFLQYKKANYDQLPSQDDSFLHILPENVNDEKQNENINFQNQIFNSLKNLKGPNFFFDQQMLKYINPFCHNIEWADQIKIFDIKYSQPYNFLNKDAEANLWYHKYSNLDIQTALKRIKDLNISQTYIKILKLETRDLNIQKKILINKYEMVIDKIKNEIPKNYNKKNSNTKLISSDHSQQKLNENMKNKVLINDKIFDVFFINNEKIWKNDITNAFFSQNDNFFDTSVVQNLDFALFIKENFYFASFNKEKFYNEIKLYKNFDFHAKNIIITGKLDFHLLLKLLDSCKIDIKDNELHAWFLKLRNLVFKVFKPGTPGIDLIFRELIFFEDYINYEQFDSTLFDNSFGILHVTFFLYIFEIFMKFDWIKKINEFHNSNAHLTEKNKLHHLKSLPNTNEKADNDLASFKEKIFIYTYTTLHRILIIIVRPFLCNTSFERYLKNSLMMRTKYKMIFFKIIKPSEPLETIYYLNHKFYNLKNLLFINGKNLFYENYLDVKPNKTNKTYEFFLEEYKLKSYFETFEILEFFGYNEIMQQDSCEKINCSAKKNYILAYYLYLR